MSAPCRCAWCAKGQPAFCTAAVVARQDAETRAALEARVLAGRERFAGRFVERHGGGTR